MSMWQAPSTNNELSSQDMGASRSLSGIPYLDTNGRVKWWQGALPLPVGTTQLYVIVRGDGRRVFSDTSVDERTPAVFGSHVVIR